MLNLSAAIGALEMGFLYGLVGLGVFLSFRVLNFPDLTVDGSFPLGGAIAATLIVQGIPPTVATLAGFVGGCLAGLCTAWLSVRFQILNLLASILTMIALYSINLRIMGQPNVALLGQQTLVTPLQQWPWGVMVGMGGVAIALKLALDWFLGTELGLGLRAVGSTPSMAEAQGIRSGAMILLGLALSNGLVGLAGALFAQTSGFADVSLGVGTIVFGLAAVILGEALVGKRRRGLGWQTLGVLLGAIAYRLAIAIALNAKILGLQAQDLNLVTAVLVGSALIGSRSAMARQR
jgi:putative tryptophan/tyrosine transport system permease protein